MTYDRSTVEALVQLYFDGVHESDTDKLSAVFHSTADLRWQENGELKILNMSDWLGIIRDRKALERKARRDFIVTIDRSDENTAFIKVMCQLPPRYFTDYLVALKLKDGWRLVSKTYRYDLRN